ncbi:septal ring lytic transglycosylase RlpA family protein [Kiloniella laminariae]|uniref:Endolytic peptidoglycan transglycosylase RlpA n=1 Tax=Kiloniella laminariae TaxID=454162 RepID=A0ABT4LLB4_9PROT|nr:septal ring lytic transglycosylase RlpA family protein [Kiloniella laminariae]MCZ4281900.1 septal ring lytic transglycosylase RlpA family protein [Kiloniella laminariae]
MRFAKLHIISAFFVALAIGLAGCAEIELASHATKQIAKPDEGKPAGRYKVGSPYQVKNLWYYPAVDYDYSETGIASWYGPGFDGKLTANGEQYDQEALTAAHRTLPMPSLIRVTNLGNGRSIKLRVNDRGPFSNSRILDVSRRAAQLLGFELAGTAKVRVEILEEESRQLAALSQDKDLTAYKAEIASSETSTRGAPTETVIAEPLDAPSSGGAAVQQPLSPSPPRIQAEPVTYNSAYNPDGVVTQIPVAETGIFVQAGSFLQLHNADRLRVKLSSLGTAQVANAAVNQQTFYRVRLGPLTTVDEADKLLQVLHDNGYTDARVVVE